MDKLLSLAEEFVEATRDLKDLTEKNEKDMLHAGMHFMSVYENLMLEVEQTIHPDYQRNINQFRKSHGL